MRIFELQIKKEVHGMKTGESLGSDWFPSNHCQTKAKQMVSSLDCDLKKKNILKGFLINKTIFALLYKKNSI